MSEKEEGEEGEEEKRAGSRNTSFDENEGEEGKLPSQEMRERINKYLSAINKALHEGPVLQKVLGVPFIQLVEERGMSDGGEYVNFILPLYPIKALRDMEPSFRDFLEYRLPTIPDFKAAQDAAWSLTSFMLSADDNLEKKVWDTQPRWWEK